MTTPGRTPDPTQDTGPWEAAAGTGRAIPIRRAVRRAVRLAPTSERALTDGLSSTEHPTMILPAPGQLKDGSSDDQQAETTKDRQPVGASPVGQSGGASPAAPTREPDGSTRAPAQGFLGVLDRAQQRHSVFGFPLAVTYKFFDDQGAFQAALVTYYGFISLFPLLLLTISVSGFVLHSDPGLQTKLVNSAFKDVPVIGAEIRNNLHNIKGSGIGLLIGILGTVYGGLGFAQASQTVFNRIYAIPRHLRPNPFRSRLRSLRVLILLGLGAVITSGLSTIPTRGKIDGFSLGFGLHLAAFLLASVANMALFTTGFRFLLAITPRVREVLIGGVLAGLAWEGLQYLGALYITHKLAHASDVYGVFGLVLGSIAWFFIEAVVVVFCAEINVVRSRHLWPRALLTPFTDNVILTDADKRSYASYARAETFKGFERIDVLFVDDE